MTRRTVKAESCADGSIIVRIDGAEGLGVTQRMWLARKVREVVGDWLNSNKFVLMTIEEGEKQRKETP